MRIVCPACAAVYNVPESLLGSEQRPLRCARCSHEWVPVAEPPRPPPEADLDASGPTLAAVLAEAEADPGMAEPALSRVPAAPAPPGSDRLAVMSPLAERWPQPTGHGVARLGWAASIVTLVILLGAAYLLRTQVQAAWPPSQRAYSALGLH